MTKAFDLTGQTFGSLTVLGRAEGSLMWRCQCVCGGETLARTCNLQRASGKKCTCAIREAARERQTTHGSHGTSEYRSWTDMLTRCRNSRSRGFEAYGARGITVCDRWADSFEAFLGDMGMKPTPKHTIERNDVNGHYEPGNCRWATIAEQANNKRNNHLLTRDGMTMNTTQWAAHIGISADALERRLNLLKWPVDKALTTPPRGWGPGHPRRSAA